MAPISNEPAEAILICHWLPDQIFSLARSSRLACVRAAASADVPSFAAHSALVITKVNAAVYRPVCYRLQRMTAARSPLVAKRFLARRRFYSHVCTYTRAYEFGRRKDSNCDRLSAFTKYTFRLSRVDDRWPRRYNLTRVGR